MPTTPPRTPTAHLHRRHVLALGLAPLAACGGGGGGGDAAPAPYTALPLPSALSHHGAAALDADRVALVGGSRGLGVLSSAVDVLDARTGAWSTRAEMTTGRADACVVALDTGRLFVHGGARSLGGSPTAEWVDLVAGTTLPAPASPTRLHHTATRLRDGRIVVAGGLTTERHPDAISPTLELWDPASGRWRYAACVLQQARHGHTATPLPDGSVLFVGGYTAGGMAATAERFDPATETLSVFASPLLARAGHLAAVRRDGRVLLVGGDQGPEAAPATPAAAWLSTDPWAAAPVPGAPAALSTEAAGALRGDELWLFGGRDTTGRAVADAWAFGAAARALPALPGARSGHSVTALDGAVLIVGGEHDGRLLADALRLA